MIRYPLFGALAQLVAHNTGSVGVRSSNLLCSTFVEVLRYKASTDYGSMGAGLVISTLPTLVLYMCMSSQVQRSLVAGAVKG